MGRPSLDLGTAGTIRIYQTATGYRAMTRYRDWDGRIRQVERHGATKGAAAKALKLAVRDRARVDGGGDITTETRVERLAEVWFAALTDLSPSTMDAYRDRLDAQVIPALGKVRVRELTPGLVDRHLAAVKTRNGASVARTTKTVLSGICRLACRHNALPSNPCRDVGRISVKRKRPPRSLSVDEVKSIRTWLTEDAKAQRLDLPDLIAFMAGTGLRIGEACAVCWEDVDLASGTVAVRGTVLRIKGVGLIIKPEPKTEAGARILELPSWCVDMLRARLTRRPPEQIAGLEVSPVFPAPLGGNLRDPSNTRGALRKAFDAMGLPDVTSHTFRKTVASLMADAGLPARAAADQLGHAQVAMTLNTYMGRQVRVTGAAQVLEQLA
jgi:integrase